MTNQTPLISKLLRNIAVLGVALLLASCGDSPPASSTPTTTSAPTPPPQPTNDPGDAPGVPTSDDIRGPRPIPTTDISSGGQPTAIGPIVGTSVPGGGPIEGPPLSGLGTPTPRPTMMPGPDGVLIITSEDRPTAAEMSVGNTLRFELDSFYDWTLGVADPTILSPNRVQGSYRAAAPGTTTVELMGDPKCLKSVPPCGAPSIGFTVTVTVR